MSDYTGKTCDYCEEPMLLCPCGLTIHWDKQPCPRCGERDAICPDCTPGSWDGTRNFCQTCGRGIPGRVIA